MFNSIHLIHILIIESFKQNPYLKLLFKYLQYIFQIFLCKLVSTDQFFILFSFYESNNM